MSTSVKQNVLVLVSAKKQRGKSTFATCARSQLEQDANNIVIETAFARVLKQLYAYLCPIQVEKLEIETEKMKPSAALIEYNDQVYEKAQSILFPTPEDFTYFAERYQVNIPERLKDALVTFRLLTSSIPNFTVRQGLQLLGTECFRETFHKNIWVDLCLRSPSSWKNVQLNTVVGRRVIIIVTDCRFINEVELSRAFALEEGFRFKVWRLERKLDLASDDHPSEKQLDTYDHFDAVLFNEGSLDEFKSMVVKMITDEFNH
jgi:hypothetical protein